MTTANIIKCFIVFINIWNFHLFYLMWSSSLPYLVGKQLLSHFTDEEMETGIWSDLRKITQPLRAKPRSLSGSPKSELVFFLTFWAFSYFYANKITRVIFFPLHFLKLDLNSMSPCLWNLVSVCLFSDPGPRMPLFLPFRSCWSRGCFSSHLSHGHNCLGL